MTGQNPGEHRALDRAEAVVLLVYTLPPDTDARVYEAWLRAEDNPFFNRIPGVRHYANWKLAGVRRGAPPPWTHLDFLALESADDLERVWFSPDLDAFRRGWVARWGYGGPGGAPPHEAVAYGHLMLRAGEFTTLPRDRMALSLTDGPGAAGGPCWRVAEALRKHYAAPPGAFDGLPWRLPAAQANPLGHDAVVPGDLPGASPVLDVVRIAGPD